MESETYLLLEDKSGSVIARVCIDTRDVERVLSFGRWRLGRCGYVYSFSYDLATGKREDVALHRFLACPAKGLVVDHINHDPLDNRRCNLRILTRAENMQNRKGPVKGKLDPFRNVYRQTKGGGYVVRIQGKYFGTYRTLEQANEIACQMRPKVMEFSQ